MHGASSDVHFTIKMTLNYPAETPELEGMRIGRQPSPIRPGRSIHFRSRLLMVGALISWWPTEAEPGQERLENWRLRNRAALVKLDFIDRVENKVYDL